MVFKYTAIDENGEKERNVITADSMEEAGKMLRERNKKVVKIEAVQSSLIDSPNFQIEERHPIEKALCRFLISSSQIEIALGQIAVMLDSGVPILNTLQIVASQSSFFLSRALFCVANKLQSGKQLKDLFHDEMPFLGRVIIGLISAGEANGDIDKMCSYSVDLLERSRKLKAQVMQALSYPVIVILATFGIVYFLMTKVIPKIMEFLTNRSGELPKITKALVDCTEYIKLNGTYLVGVPIVAIIAVILLRKNEVSAFHLDYLFLRMPIFGKVFRSSNNMLWCRTFGALLNSGIGILPALEYSREAVS
ncbi:MAG: type II secretion system F family protein, partial [Lentisphaeria bacterium]